MLKLKELISKSKCDCGNSCCSVNEDIKHVVSGKKKLQRLMKDESEFRLHMNQLVLIMSKDDLNKDLGNDVMKSYKDNVTNFMRDVVRAVKKIK
tara:strand:- start:49 stop:330 length:282 start_codon:yes stop_codon:yes gene_type:complete